MKGIYKILNKTNGKVYVGQSVDIKERRDAHFEALRSGRHYNSYLQKSFNKHGEKNFHFEVIEETDDLDEREIYWISIFKSNDPKFGYNLNSGGKKFTMNDLVRKKISASLKVFHLNNEGKSLLSEKFKGKNNPFYGKTHKKKTIEKILESRKWYKHSAEIKQKMSVSRSGENHPNFGKKFSDDWRKKLSESHKGQEPGNKIQFTKEQIKEIIAMFKDGEKLKSIADYFGVTNTPIKRVLVDNGCYEQRNPRKQLSVEQLRDAKSLLESGKSLKFVSELYGLSPKGLKKKLIKNSLMEV